MDTKVTMTFEGMQAKWNNNFLKVVIIASLTFIMSWIIGYALLWITGTMYVDGSSMNPTLTDRDVLVGKRSPSRSDISRGDIVTFWSDEIGRVLVKRVVAVPGDTITCRGFVIYVNGVPEDNNLDPILNGGIIENKTITLKKDQYFCMGDNRNDSYDCRDLGPVDFSSIRERVDYMVCHRDADDKKMTWFYKV